MPTIQKTIVDLFGLDKMEPAKAAEMVNRLGKLVFQAALVRSLPLLSDADLAAYENMVSKPDAGEQLFIFLGEKVPDFENIIKEEAENLRKELAGEFKEAGM
jgi:hypothetical protein